MFTLMVDDDIQLALIEESFAPLYAQLVAKQQAYLSQWLAWPPYCRSEQDFQLFIQNMLHDYADGKVVVCAMFYRGELVGNCSLQEINRDLQKARIGYWLSQEHQGKGIVTRAVSRLIDLAFNTYQLEKVELAAASGNLASQAVAKRLGFNQEGIITRAENLNGRVVDHVVFGLTRTNAE
ncbi:GNAT family protein [Vibrio fluvialis]|uniref:GNAT family N-acetyltransferase n=1 Tax=Vibrio fluvialis TaxID=676 RepID=UPI000CEB47CA|nr:GNAT family protein [Vibrio fluvialis]AVH33472.1 RimJ/RimL family protein N-acetyltransferase [Vibrio fluvialis]EKO3930845.1 GNAT family N-acetyltransferase [Vibrio fluvialis]MBL4279313.1 GNAT family N-acetyltransferase [Vibrio fluvialis]